MRKRFKKVYVEITNHCNLSCSFCIQNKREVQHISISQFKILLEKLKGYTDYLYFHILGEPLMHPEIQELITLANHEGFYVNITTNGYLIGRIQDNLNIRQVNVSLHSYDERYGKSLENYLDDVFQAVDQLSGHGTYVSLRLWVNTFYHEQIIAYINKRYQTQLTNKEEVYRIKERVFVNRFHEFIWPDLNNYYYCSKGSCYGLRDHIGILVDGTIVPCCLDTEGVLRLGNIYEDELEDVLTTERCLRMKEGFSQNQKVEELCKHCSFLETKSLENK